MIYFASVAQRLETNDAILILAETTYDESILGSASAWIVAPYLAKPAESVLDFDCESNHSSQEFTKAMQSSVAQAMLKSIVQLSNEGKSIIIGCYDYNVGKSHLSILLDYIEDTFVDDAPELKMLIK